MKLNTYIDLLEISAADIAASEDKLRAAEGKNLLQAIWNCKEDLNEGHFSEADEILHQIGQRINALMDNPEHAGQHEQFRETESAEKVMEQITMLYILDN